MSSKSTTTNSTPPVPPPPNAARIKLWATDPAAKAEEENWPDEAKLKGQRAANDLRMLKFVGFAQVAVAAVLVLMFLAAFVVWSLHYITPWEMLPAEKLAKIQAMIFSGALGAIVSGYAKRFLPKED